MRTIGHKVRCSGTYHEVWRDTEGRLHRTCDGEGCTLAFEAARALLRGMPDKKPGRAHRQGRYSAAWGEPWENAKRRAWQVRAARRRTRGELVAYAARRLPADDGFDDFLEAAYKPTTCDTTKARIIQDLRERISADLRAATYREAQSRRTIPKVRIHVHLAAADGQDNCPPHPGVAWIAKTPTETREPGHVLTTNHTLRSYITTVRDAFALRAALGGTNLVHAGGQRLFAAALLEDHRHTAGELIVLVMRPGRGLAAYCEPAVVQRINGRAELVRWERWPHLSEQAIGPYASFMRAQAVRLRRARGPSPDVEVTAICLEATRGRSLCMPDRLTHVDGWVRSIVVLRQRQAKCVSALARMPSTDNLEEAYRRLVVETLEYATQWGGITGCDRSCALFGDDSRCQELAQSQSWSICRRPVHQDRAPLPVNVGPFRVFHTHDSVCAILDPLRTLNHINIERISTKAELRICQSDMRQLERLIDRAGFIVKSSGELEELPCP